MSRALALLSLVLAPLVAHAQDDAGRKATIEYVRSLQTDAGGFLSMKPTPNIRIAPTLRATSAGVRALHYLGGAVQKPKAAAEYVDRCFDAKIGGFSDMPEGTPDVFSTAVGMMAVAELEMPLDKYAGPATKYLTENAKNFEEIRIAVAGLEAAKTKSPKANDWIAAIRKMQKDDGSFGSGAGAARDTGGAAVALMRLGEKADADATLKVLRSGQRADGGFGKQDADASDLETSYRVLRCFVMLKAKPDRVEGLRSFIAKCRNADGGYGVAPGQPSNIGATYYAAIMTYWLDDRR